MYLPAERLLSFRRRNKLENAIGHKLQQRNRLKTMPSKIKLLPYALSCLMPSLLSTLLLRILNLIILLVSGFLLNTVRTSELATLHMVFPHLTTPLYSIAINTSTVFYRFYRYNTCKTNTDQCLTLQLSTDS